MKNFLFALVTGCIPVLAATNSVSAQSLNNIVSNEQFRHTIKIDNSVFPVVENHSVIVDANTINTKALKDFRKSYKSVSNETWQKNATGFTAQFLSDGVNNAIYYDKKGNWNASLKGYSEDKLNHEVRDIVKRKYYDYTISYVQEIETNGTNGVPTYIVHLEDKTTVKLVRVSDGDMDIYQEFEKQN